MMLLYIADSIQELIGGKFVATGLYTDRELVMQIPEGANPHGLPFGISGLCILVVVRGVATGTNQAVVELIDPVGGIARLADMEVNSQDGKSLNFNIQMNPFMVSGFGEYNVRVTIGGKSWQDRFQITRLQVPANQPMQGVR